MHINLEQRKSSRYAEIENKNGAIVAEIRQKISPVSMKVEPATVYLFYSGVMLPAFTREIAEILTEAASICDEWNASVGMPDFIAWKP